MKTRHQCYKVPQMHKRGKIRAKPETWAWLVLRRARHGFARPFQVRRGALEVKAHHVKHFGIKET